MEQEQLHNSQSDQSPPPSGQDDFSTVIVLLLKGVIYREGNDRLWNSLLNLQTRLREYVAVLGLDLVLDEAEGYSFLTSRSDHIEEHEGVRVPRLIARRPLSYPVSLLLVLMRKKLAEFDASSGDTRLILNREEIVELVRVFLPDSSNEAKLIDQIETHIHKIIELGFLRRLKPAGSTSGGPPTYEVKRIIKAYVDAQWLADFDTKLAEYQALALGDTSEDLR